MMPNQGKGIFGFSPAARRYSAPAQRESRAAGFFGYIPKGQIDGFRRALSDLSQEDEALPSLEDQGPIVFKDGIFQIEIKGNPGDSALDPALKGLIDSILEPRHPPEGQEEGR
ncbi:MAG: hypothetical protein NT061_01430 [Spirochaetes bacterium]|nr:hypothetical protein [Spirochaetota bacterium]